MARSFLLLLLAIVACQILTIVLKLPTVVKRETYHGSRLLHNRCHKMNIDKLLRKKQRALADKNKLHLAVACHNLADWYQENQDYENALSSYREEAAAYDDLGMRIERARAHRRIGEMFMLLENFERALEHEVIYLRTAVELGNKIEEQRAFATIGRVHLLKVQSSNTSANGSDEMAKSLKSAEKAFLRSQLICKSLTDLPKTELLDMSARLFLNLGVTSECKEEYDEAIKYMEKAMSICRLNDFWDLLHQCYVTTGLLYANKLNDTTTALRFLNLAINTAERLSTNRTIRVCQTLQSKSEVLIKMADFQGAKQVLRKAYKMKTTDISDRQAIEKTLKIVAAMCYAENNLIKIESEDYGRKKRLYETMGDGACRLKNFAAAIGYYAKMLEAAQQNDESGKQLIPIYVSLYQTYKDKKEYGLALHYMWLEYEICKDVPNEAYSTLFGIAETYQLDEKDFWSTDGIYDRARQEAQKMKSKRKERKIMLEQIELREKHDLDTLATLMKEELKTFDANVVDGTSAGIGRDDDDDAEEEEAIESATSEEINTPDIGDDICLDDLTDTDSESDEPKASTSAACNTTAAGRTRTLRKRNVVAVRRNEKGETQLHRACITGNATMVRRLIDQGHPVNVRDHAGWLPLHEASNHGFKAIVELLLDSGAWINDKGGTRCDGFTPLHDACANGVLETVELLLDRGANATLRNDLGHTPLQTLEIWRKGVVLNAEEQSYYETMYARMKQNLDKAGISSNDSPKKTRTRGKSTTPRKRIVSSSSSDNENSERIETVANILDDAFPTCEQNESEELCSSPDYPVDYPEIMANLRKGNFQNKVDSIRGTFHPVPKITRRPGMLGENEVSTDEWLDDDIGPSRKKRRFIGGERPFSSDSNISTENRNVENLRQLSASLPLPSDVNISSTNGQNVIEIDHNGSDEENSADAFNILMSAGNSSASTSGRRKKRLSSGSGSSSSRQQQTSLIENGFARYRLETAENTSQQPQVSSTVVSPHKNPNPTISVKVKVEQNLLNVPVNGTHAHELTIEWLAEEAAKRYYNLKGVKPVLRLTTADGAIFENSDPLNLTFGETAPLASTVLDWIMPPLSQRYLEACATSKVDADQCIQSHLDLVASTQSLTINDQIIIPKLSRPLFKSLHFQKNLLIIDLTQCFLEDEGMKFLAQALPTINQLTTLNLSGNLVTANGLKYLSATLEASTDTTLLPELSTLNLSFNPLQNQSIPPLAKLCQHLSQLRSLSLSSVEFTDLQDFDLKFNALTDIDLSLNEFTSTGLSHAIDRLNACKLMRIDLSYCFASSARNSQNANDLVNALIKLLNAGICAHLEEVHLDGCHLNDVDCWRIIQAIGRSKQLLVVTLRDNPSLTKVTWKCLLEHLNARHLHLEGCSALIADLTETDVRTLQTKSIEECCKNIIISLATADDSNEPDAGQIALLKRMWNVVSRDAGKLFKHNRNLLLTIEPEIVANDDWIFLSL